LVCYLMFDAKMAVHGVAPLKGAAQEAVALLRAHGVVPPRESVFWSVILLCCARLLPLGAMFRCLAFMQMT